MSSGNAKDMRKQIRNVAQEMMPQVLASETVVGLKQAIVMDLQTEINAKLQAIQKMVEESLKRIDDRAMDVQSFMFNQALQQTIKNAPSHEPMIPMTETETPRV
jgi:hypothetical protein